MSVSIVAEQGIGEIRVVAFLLESQPVFLTEVLQVIRTLLICVLDLCPSRPVKALAQRPLCSDESVIFPKLSMPVLLYPLTAFDNFKHELVLLIHQWVEIVAGPRPHGKDPLV